MAGKTFVDHNNARRTDTQNASNIQHSTEPTALLLLLSLVNSTFMRARARHIHPTKSNRNTVKPVMLMLNARAFIPSEQMLKHARAFLSIFEHLYFLQKIK